MKQIRCSLSAERLERLLLATKPAVENMDSTGTEEADDDRWMRASWHRLGYTPRLTFRFQQQIISWWCGS